jgi:hypothetical protein
LLVVQTFPSIQNTKLETTAQKKNKSKHKKFRGKIAPGDGFKGALKKVSPTYIVGLLALITQIKKLFQRNSCFAFISPAPIH